MRSRIGKTLALVAALIVAAPVVEAEGLRPRANPRIMQQIPLATPAPGAIVASGAPMAPAQGQLRPRPRPEGVVAQVSAAPPEMLASAAAPTGLARLPVTTLRPRARPASVTALARRADGAGITAATQVVAAARPAPEEPKGKGRKQQSAKGSVCGVAAIRGEVIAPIRSKVSGCGLADGVRVTSISGVRLSMSATIDCDTARALNTWVERVLQPAYRNQVVELKIAGHYVCRPRNNRKGAKVSEHGRGKAIDIAGIVLSSGKTMTVLRNYDNTMRKVNRGACGIFGTTLGPGSDGFHEDHLHFDTARHGNGPYCR